MACTPGALLHLPGIGPRKLRALHDRGIATWFDLLDDLPPTLPGFHSPSGLHRVLEQSQRAFAGKEINTLINLLKPADHWRILHDFGHEATYLDIETTGDDENHAITVVACLHRGTLRTFLHGENLDDLLDLLDDVRLLVTFNGIGFDLPCIEDTFRIPKLTCPHLDLRWICYHAGLKGGLKAIENTLEVHRPRDLVGTDGAEAVWLWRQWSLTREPGLLLKLVRYCAADVITLHLLREKLLIRHGLDITLTNPDSLWSLLPEQAANAMVVASTLEGHASA